MSRLTNGTSNISENGNANPIVSIRTNRNIFDYEGALQPMFRCIREGEGGKGGRRRREGEKKGGRGRGREGGRRRE